MMFGYEIFDFEIGKCVFVDYVFIVVSGEIMKVVRNWFGNKFDVMKCSQVMFMDCDDILNLFVVINLLLLVGVLFKGFDDDELLF